MSHLSNVANRGSPNRDILLNDSEIVEGLRRKDPEAIRHLSECLVPSIWRYVYVRAKGDLHLAEDVISEAVLALVKAVAVAGTRIRCPNAWLRAVAINKLQDHFRAASRMEQMIEQSSEAVCEPSRQEETNDRQAEVIRVMDDLPEKHRLVLEWKYVDRLSVREIALRLATTEKAVESILFRARREFRDGLARLHSDDDPFRLIRKGSQGVVGRSSKSACAESEFQFEFETWQMAGFKDH